MENKSDGKSSSKGLPTNIGTLPARLQNRIISGADHESKHAVGKEVAKSAHSPKASAASPAGVLSVNNLNVHHKQSIVKKPEPTCSNNKIQHQFEQIKCAKWLDLQNVNSKNSNLISCIEAIRTVERELCPLMEDRIFLEKWDSYYRHRIALQKIFRKMLAEELKFCCKENVEQYFWKALYYNSIESMKKAGLFKLSNGNKALELINEGLVFYEELLDFLQSEHQLKIDDATDGKYIRNGITGKPGTVHKNEILAKVSAQKILINLGDLSRYKEQIEMTGSFRQAREYYEQAQQLLPTNGKPYNQLAILSIYLKKKFDAIYYHMRSLLASNPIHSAKESLKVLFDEIRKKQETLMPKEVECKGNNENVMPMRREIWIHPDGSRRLHRLPKLSNQGKKYSTGNDESVESLDLNQLNKRFLLSFLNIQGKLFTGIGMDSFDSVAHQMFNDFKVLLSHSPLIFTYQRLLQIVSLNIFSVFYNNREEIKQQKREIRIQAFTVGSIMFAMILDRINDILNEHFFIDCKETNKVLKLDAKPVDNEIESIPCSPKHNGLKLDLPEDAFTLVCAVKVWCNWLLNYDDLRNPSMPYINSEKLRQMNIEPWKSFAKFLNMTNGKDKCDEILSQNNSLDHKPILLDEDTYLKGFAPLKFSDETLTYCHKISDSKNVKNTLRLVKIFQYANSLCDFDNQIIKKILIESDTIAFVGSSLCSAEQNLVEDNTMDNQEDFEELLSFPEELNKEFIEKTSLNNDQNGELSVCSPDNPEICDLIRRKNELEKKQKMQESYHQTLQGLLRQSGISLHIEVRPKYLVPDTNCFIDFLDQLKIIASKSERFYLFVPITVVNELEGLSKGLREPSNMLATVESDNNLSLVTKRSKAALEFIRSKNNGIKCVTTKGSILNSSVFTLEESENQISNDDKILQTALNLCKNNVDRYEDGIHYIETEVVLLTKDRNLRVKALARNLSVSHLSGFLKWAGYAT